MWSPKLQTELHGQRLYIGKGLQASEELNKFQYGRSWVNEADVAMHEGSRIGAL